MAASVATSMPQSVPTRASVTPLPEEDITMMNRGYEGFEHYISSAPNAAESVTPTQQRSITAEEIEDHARKRPWSSILARLLCRRSTIGEQHDFHPDPTLEREPIARRGKSRSSTTLKSTDDSLLKFTIIRAVIHSCRHSWTVTTLS
jgi:hypothetical protein